MSVKTTVYLPDELKMAISAEAQRRGSSEAEVIRETLRAGLGASRPRPRGGLFSSGDPIARDADAHLRGFGEP